MLEAVVIALFALALVLLLLAGGLVALKLQFLAKAQRAKGAVVSMRSDRPAETGAPSQLLQPVIGFVTAQGDEVEFIGGPPSSPPRYRIGDTVPIRYLADDPAGSARVESFRGFWLAPTLLAALSVPAALVAIGLLLWQGSATQDAAELRRSGTKITGVITRIDLADPDGAEPPMFVLTVEADAPSDGSRLVFVSEPIEAMRRGGYTIGDRVPVLVDPADPDRYRIELR